MLIEFLIIKYNNNKKTIDRIYFIDLTKQYNTINKQQSKSGNSGKTNKTKKSTNEL